jgi:hypothetical protein
MLKIESVKPASFHERFHEDSLGRKWDFVQKGKVHAHWATQYGPDHPWNQDKLVWVCTVCGGEEPVEYKNVIHDEVIVPDPTNQLDQHDCNLTYVSQVMDS